VIEFEISVHPEELRVSPFETCQQRATCFAKFNYEISDKLVFLISELMTKLISILYHDPDLIWEWDRQTVSCQPDRPVWITMSYHCTWDMKGQRFSTSGNYAGGGVETPESFRKGIDNFFGEEK